MGTHLYDSFHILERIFEGNQELRKEVLLQIQTLAVPLLHITQHINSPAKSNSIVMSTPCENLLKKLFKRLTKKV